VAFLNSCLQIQYDNSANISAVNDTSARYSCFGPSDVVVKTYLKGMSEQLCCGVCLNWGKYYETMGNNNFH
jgi:hypothetical protein